MRRQPFIKHLCYLLHVLLMCSSMRSLLSNVFISFTGLPPKQSTIVSPPFEPNTSCPYSRNSHADGPYDKACGNRLSEGSQPATREVTQEVKLSLSVPLPVRIYHKPYGAHSRNNKRAIVGLWGGWGTQWLLLKARWALGNIWKISFLSGGGLTLWEEKAWNAKEGRWWGQMAGLCTAQSSLCGPGVTWSRMKSVGVRGGLDNVLPRHKHLHVSYGGKWPVCIWPWYVLGVGGDQVHYLLDSCV